MTALAVDFVASYTPSSEAKIAFAWNGRHGADFDDANMAFRTVIGDYFEEHAQACSLPLIAALYRAETQWAKEAWCVRSVVAELAQELLQRGGVAYLDVYLAGACCGMDACMESGNISLSKTRCEELLAYCKASAFNAEAGLRERWTMLAQRFACLIAGAA